MIFYDFYDFFRISVIFDDCLWFLGGRSYGKKCFKCFLGPRIVLFLAQSGSLAQSGLRSTQSEPDFVLDLLQAEMLHP